MSRYKVTLKPIDSFFFGGEQTFDNGISQSFIARSNRFPQQTALLGMVRYQLLKQEGLLSVPGKRLTEAEMQKVNKLIGGFSFSIDSQQELEYGKIIGLSTVFIQHRNKILLSVPYTFGTRLTFSSDNVRMCVGGNVVDTVPQLTVEDNQFDYYNNPDRFVDDEGSLYCDKELYQSSTQIGIIKAQDGDDNNDGFFKQEMLRFKDINTCFAFFLDLEEGITLDNDIVFIGAQRSCFKMIVEKCDEYLFVPDHPEGSLLICSPTYVSDIDALNDCCLFHWTRSLPFRNIIHAENGKLKSGPVAYNRYTAVCAFLQPGSVLFYKKEKIKQMEQILFNSNLIKIGYNNYHINEIKYK